MSKTMIHAGKKVRHQEVKPQVSSEVEDEKEPPSGLVIANLFKGDPEEEGPFHPDRVECESVIEAAAAQDPD